MAKNGIFSISFFPFIGFFSKENGFWFFRRYYFFIFLVFEEEVGPLHFYRDN